MKRDPAKEKFWREAIAEAGRSGQTVRGFCRERGLKETQFYAWRRELRLREAEGSTKPGFVELVRPAEKVGSGVSIRVDERIDIRLDRDFDGAALKVALGVLVGAVAP